MLRDIEGQPRRSGSRGKREKAAADAEANAALCADLEKRLAHLKAAAA